MRGEEEWGMDEGGVVLNEGGRVNEDGGLGWSVEFFFDRTEQGK